MKRNIALIICFFIVIVFCRAGETGIPENLVKVEGGTFTLGREGLNEYRPEIRLSDFYISRYEVTVGQWEVFLHEMNITFQWKTMYIDFRERCPQEHSAILGVSWKNAILFANWVSQKSGLEECYEFRDGEVYWNRDKKSFRLPTDAEWEFAARGGTLSRNYLYSGGNDPDEVAWWGRNSGEYSHPVGTKKPNELGIYDMSGNAAEWCWDIDTDQLAEGNVSLVDPAGPSVDDYELEKGRRWRISRGGSEGSLDEFLLTPYHRSGTYEFGESPIIGFRLVCDAEAVEGNR